jgi:hypothetical protein
VQAPDDLAGERAALKNRTVLIDGGTVVRGALLIEQLCKIFEIKQAVADRVLALGRLARWPVRSRLGFAGRTPELLTVRVLKKRCKY